jgi:hypothetical protein
MPGKRACSCEKCGQRFEYLHHLHRHGVLQHGLGFRIDLETDCIQAFRPTNLEELQDKFRGWQRHEGVDSRSRSPRPSVIESARQRGRAPSRRSRSWRKSRSRSPIGYRRDIMVPLEMQPRSRGRSARVVPQDSRLVLPSIKEAVKSRSVHPSVSPSAAEAVPAALEQCSTLPSNFRKSSSTSKMALCAPSSLDVRIDELLKTPEDPGSPNRLADISFGMDPFGDLGQLADHSFRMDLVGDLSKSISPARSSSVARTVSAAVSVNPSISQSRPSLDQLADHSLGWI